MAESPIDWNSISPSSQVAFRRAVACVPRSGDDPEDRPPDSRAQIQSSAQRPPSEINPEVRSANLLYGMLHMHLYDNEVGEFLSFFNLSRTGLINSLTSAGLVEETPPTFDGPPLSDFPPMSDDIAEALSLAMEFSQKLSPEPDEVVHLRQLFGGILGRTQSSAVLALVATGANANVDIQLETVRQVYEEFLQESPDAKLSTFLERNSSRFLPPPLDIDEKMESDSWSRVDTIGLAPLVNGLDDMLNAKGTTFPLALAVTGRWGMGKSSVMGQLKEKLESTSQTDNYRRQWHTVWIEAWKYERSERLWAAMAKGIYEQPMKRMSAWNAAKFKFKLEAMRQGGVRSFFLRRALPSILAAFFIALLAVWGVGKLDGIPFLNQLEIAGVSIHNPVTGVVGFFAAAMAFASRFGGLFTHPFKRSLEGYVRRPKYEEQLGFTSEAGNDIDQMIHLLTEKENQGLAVFVDDLDRCNPKHVAEIVAAINQIFHSPQDQMKRQCIFVIGMDKQVVEAGLEVEFIRTINRLKLKGSSVGYNYAHEFLAKIIQMTVGIPNHSDESMSRLLGDLTEEASPIPDYVVASPDVALVETFVGQLGQQEYGGPSEVRKERTRLESQSTELTDEQRAAWEVAERQVMMTVLGRDSREFLQARQEGVRRLRNNPRMVKRFDNAFRFQLMVAYGQSGPTMDFSLDQQVALAKWVAIQMQWPEFVEDFSLETTLVKFLEDDANKSGSIPITGSTKLELKWASHSEMPALSKAFEDDSVSRRIAPLLQRHIRILPKVA